MEIKNPLIPGEKLHFLGVIGIIKSAIRIPFRYPSFIILTFLTSLPLFCTLLVDEINQMIVQPNRPTFKETYSLLSQHPPAFVARKWIKETSSELLQEDLLYMIFFEFLHLILVVSTVYSASVIYTKGRRLGLHDMLHDSITKTRWTWPFVTFIYVALLSKISWYAIKFWHAIGLIFIHVNSLSVIMWIVVTLVVTGKRLEYLASWNMGVIISILEEKSVFEAMSRSARLGKGNRRRGAVLMLFHFVWWYSLSLTRNVRGSFSVRIAYALLQTSLLCVGKVMKWSVCMVYYYDCKMRQGQNAELEEET